MSGREATAERLLERLGFAGVRVDACGHEASLAALAVPEERWAEVIARSDEVAGAVRSAGFRYVTLDLDDEPAGG